MVFDVSLPLIGVLDLAIDDPDGLPADDRRYALLDPPEPASLAIVANGGRLGAGAFYLERALRAGEEISAVRLHPLSPRALTEQALTDHDAVVLVGTEGLDRPGRGWVFQFADHALPGRIVVVNTTAASAPFVRRLAQTGRVVISATESAVQRYDTIFPEFFVRALAEAAADTDKNGRVSVWEAFEFTSAEVRRWYQQQGRLATERSILDDTGDGVERDVDQRGQDGAVAARTYVGAGVEVSAVVADPSLTPLVVQRDELEVAVAELQAQKETMDAEAYTAELERLVVDLAKVSREIRRLTTS